MKSLHGFPHGKLWIMFRDMVKLINTLGPPPKNRDMIQIWTNLVKVKSLIRHTIGIAFGRESRALTITWSRPYR
jgi:hypothetical protein